MSKKKIQCNICGYPKRVIYTEYDPETRVYKEHSHIVNCLGHEVPYYLHNLHPNYDAFQMYLAKTHRKNKETK